MDAEGIAQSGNRQRAFLDLVSRERERQLRKWGISNHSLLSWFAILGEEFGEFAKEVVELSQGRTTDPRRALVELVQTAAVASAIYEEYFTGESEHADVTETSRADS